MALCLVLALVGGALPRAEAAANVRFPLSGDPSRMYILTYGGGNQSNLNAYGRDHTGTHDGTDYFAMDISGTGATQGTAVYAVADGTVVSCYSPNGQVILKHTVPLTLSDGVTTYNTWYSVYAHMYNLKVTSVGAWVSGGQQLGMVGSAGTGAVHLHFALSTALYNGAYAYHYENNHGTSPTKAVIDGYAFAALNPKWVYPNAGLYIRAASGDAMDTEAAGRFNLDTSYAPGNRNNGTQYGGTPSNAVNLGNSFYASIYRLESPNERLSVGVATNTTSVYAIGKNSSARQRWLFTRQSDGSYKIASVHNGYLLNVDNGSSEDGTLATVWMDLNNDYQKWFIYPAEQGYMLVSKGTGDCLNIYAASIGNQATLSAYGGYKEQLLEIHVHKYATTTVSPTCISEGYVHYACECGDYYDVVNAAATGEHNWELADWLDATCSNPGYQLYACENCAELKEEYQPALEHSWAESGRTEATCQQPATVIYTCGGCGETRSEILEGEFSGWSETKPEGVSEELIETKTQYRYRDYETTTSSDSSVSGMEQVGSEWVYQKTQTVDYAASWPAGFNTNHWLYSAYNKTPAANQETDTTKTVVTGSSGNGYILWHWCRGSYTAGPINRYMSDVWTSEFGTFHAFYSDNMGSNTDPNGNNGGGEHVRYYYNRDCCADTYWYFAQAVTRQTFDTYQKMYTHGKWGAWSDWTDTACERTETRQVEPRTMYRYVNAPEGGHNYTAVVTPPTCIEAGYTTYTCACGDSYVADEVAALGHAVTGGVCGNCGEAFLTIVKQPKSVTVASGETAAVTVEAEGDGLTYTWYYKNPGAAGFSKTTAFAGKTYSIAMSEARNGRQVYCIVKDAHGNSVKSAVVTLSMKAADPVTIVKQPESVTVASGETAAVTVEAVGDGLTYTWYYKNPGSASFSKTTAFTGKTYSIAMSEARNGRQVYCIVKDAHGNSVKSNVVTLSMKAVKPVTIVTQPKSVWVPEGEKAVVTVEAEGDGLTYKWYYKTPGESKYTYTSSFKGNTYSVTMNEARSGRYVYCKVTDAYGNTVKSKTVSLNMQTPLEITSQPKSVKVAKGATAKVTVKAQGDGLTYEWYFKNPGESKYSYTPSFTGNSYSVTMNATRDGRYVYCKVYDKYGNVVKTSTVSLRMK